MDDDRKGDGDDGGIATFGRLNEVLSRSDRYRHLFSERGELEFHSYLNGPLEWLIVGALWGGPLYATSSGNVASLSVTLLHNRVYSLEQQLEAGGQSLMASPSELLASLFVAGERA